jgi:hypothetical protein
MSEKWASSCRGKRHYNSERRADEAARASQVVYGVKMNSYPCEFHPGKWVVGNTYACNGKRARMEAVLTEQVPPESASVDNQQHNC